MTLQLSPIDPAESKAYPIRFPEIEGRDQHEEWCEVYIEGQWQRLRLHDYAEIYRVPGLYEHLFADTLQCSSPQRVVGLLGEVLREWSQSPTSLSVIDLGAGNGMIGEQLRALGVRALVGVDIIAEAREAAERDRPGLYDTYVVADLCSLSDFDAVRLSQHRPNCLTTVSALGFGDIPPKAFYTAFNLIAEKGWVAFNIKESFLAGKDESGFSRLIREMSDREIIQIQAYRRYSHRLAIDGRKLNYVAMVAQKLKHYSR
jgi:predicted TPR repeat methyltransferase